MILEHKRQFDAAAGDKPIVLFPEGTTHNGRALLTSTLTARYADVAERGWRVSRGDIRRDVHRLLGGSYEEFVTKRL